MAHLGVLEPDELSSMMGRKSLPAVQEDLHRSTESMSTLKSDCTVETGQEFFMCDAATPDKRKDLGSTEAVPSPSKLCFHKRIYKVLFICISVYCFGVERALV